jgi:hypothetical protein
LCETEWSERLAWNSSIIKFVCPVH